MLSSSSETQSRVDPASQPRNYNGIDLVKFICAIMVFIIHIPPFQGELSAFSEYVNFGLQNCLCRLAVPFFFVSSGFFLFKKMPPYELNTETVRNYCFKILRLLGIWYVLLFVGGTGHLWYLGATVVAVVLLSLCIHFRIRFRYICISACFLYVIGLLGESYYGLIAPLTRFTVFKYIFKGYELAFMTTRNGVFMGFIFVLMGAAFSYYEIKLKPRTALLGFASFVLCLFAEAFLLRYNDIPVGYNMYIFSLPATFFLFAFACNVRLKDRAAYKHLRSMGVIIYFSHILIDKFVSMGIRVIEKIFALEALQYQFILSLLCTLLFAFFAEWLSCKDRFKWINRLIS